jgi:D-glycero-D-manno-heptose 1,7-bisphosphate phosphatase
VRRAVFFDRDGVVNQLVPDPGSGLPESPLDVDDVALLPAVAPALRRLHDAGFLLVGVSNQPAAAKGSVTLEELQRVQARVVELLEGEGVTPDGFFLCFHHPHGVVPELSAACDCRKPAPGLLLAAAAELDLDLAGSWMVGDTDADVEAGRAAGCRTVLVEHPNSAHKRRTAVEPDLRAAGLEDASKRIVVLAAR